MSRDIEIIGDGCAALSFAARADEVNGNVTLIRPNNAPEAKDHVWGFWSDPLLLEAKTMAKQTWHKWAIITHDEKAVLGSETKPYNAFKRSEWMDHCHSLAESSGVKIIDQKDWVKSEYSLLFDTRPPVVPVGCVLQHFRGIEIRTAEAKFDPNIAILMDFRVDQSKGMHFIYLLPYSESEALVESTIFSPNLVDSQYYLDSIDTYLAQHHQVIDYSITHEENGVIPLGKLSPHDVQIPGLGGNGGAIRPASGYAFLFIQRQIDTAIEQTKRGKALAFTNPHKKLDLWMDSVLLTVLKQWPEQGPTMFLRMAKALTGDQFVNFLSGDAGLWTKLKVIFAMPKWPFIKAVTKQILPKRKATKPVVA